MTTLHIEAEYTFNPDILALTSLVTDDETGAVLLPIATGAVLSIAGPLGDATHGEALEEALDLFDDLLAEHTFDADLEELPSMPVGIRVVDVDALTDLLQRREPPQDEPVAV